MRGRAQSEQCCASRQCQSADFLQRSARPVAACSRDYTSGTCSTPQTPAAGVAPDPWLARTRMPRQVRAVRFPLRRAGSAIEGALQVQGTHRTEVDPVSVKRPDANSRAQALALEKVTQVPWTVGQEAKATRVWHAPLGQPCLTALQHLTRRRPPTHSPAQVRGQPRVRSPPSAARRLEMPTTPHRLEWVAGIHRRLRPSFFGAR